MIYVAKVVPVLLSAAALSGCMCMMPMENMDKEKKDDMAGMEMGGRPSGSTQQDKADTARRYRKEAANLREMAQRRAVEAEVLEQKEGSESEMVKRNKQLVQELLTAADAVEEKARELRKDVPHGMVQ